jgi:hypothetical protein
MLTLPNHRAAAGLRPFVLLLLRRPVLSVPVVPAVTYQLFRRPVLPVPVVPTATHQKARFPMTGEPGNLCCGKLLVEAQKNLAAALHRSGIAQASFSRPCGRTT